MLRILDITAPDINNGNGIRITLWVAGCKHHCKGCHNEWTWNFDQGKKFSEDTDEILNKLSNWLSREYVQGITISGGDPLCQDIAGLLEIKKIINWIRYNFPKKDIWMYTGYEYENLNYSQKEVADMCDILVDGPYKEELRDIAHCPFRGSTNQRIIYINKNSNFEK